MSTNDDAEPFVVNKWMFCGDHGSELCNLCCVDFRWGNNQHSDIDDNGKRRNELPKGMNPSDRPPLNVLKLGAVKSSTKDEHGEFRYKCKVHSILDCTNCFDFVKALNELVKNPEKGNVEDRDELVKMLKVMKIDKSKSKMPAEGLEKQLGHALLLAQKIPSIGDWPVDPSKLPKWKKAKDAKGKEMQNIMSRHSMQEAMAHMGNPGGATTDDPFMDLRQTIRHIGYRAENEKFCILKDNDTDLEGITIRILDIYKLADDTPLILLLFQHATVHTPLNQNGLVGLLQDLGPKAGGMPSITCTLVEIRMAKKLLYKNATQIASSYSYTPKKPYEKHFTLSFIVPMGPLDSEAIAKLTAKSGCAVCGEKTKSSCSQCKSVSYCGAACQKLDWSDHKKFCVSLKNGKWMDITFTSLLASLAAKGTHGPTPHAVSISFQNPGLKPKPETSDVSPNVHGNDVFLVKIQRPVVPGSVGIMNTVFPGDLAVYDAERSFKGVIPQKENPVAYVELVRECLKGTVQNLKMYRYARRKGDWGLEICVDAQPLGGEPVW